jgi:hypothetical protein
MIHSFHPTIVFITQPITGTRAGMKSNLPVWERSEFGQEKKR